MKRIYNFLIWKLGLIIVALTYPYILAYVNSWNNSVIDCNEWYKTHTGVCDDFSYGMDFNTFLLSIILIILPILFTIIMWSYIIKPKKYERDL